MKIVVLCGGTSTERDVSLNSSEKIALALKSKGHQVLLVDVFWGTEKGLSFDTDQDIKTAADGYRQLTTLLTDEVKNSRGFFGTGVLEICAQADICFLGLHGANGEDGRIQATFDLMNIKYTGSGYLGSAIAMSKERTKLVLSQFIRMPKGITVHAGNPFKDRIPAPCVIKPSNGGSSIGVIIVTNDEDYEPAIKSALRYDDTVIVEEFVDGRELTQGVIDGQALPPVEIIPAEGFYDYQHKYDGKTLEVCPADIPSDILKKMSDYSLLAGELLGLSVYYRMDYLLKSDGTLYCLEANTLPGMTNTSLIPQEAAAIGIDYPTLCEKIAVDSLKRFEQAD